MIIGVVGMGLIGGSFCRAIKEKTPNTCLGLDRDPGTIQAALLCGAIDRAITKEELKECDLVLICLHPAAILTFLEEARDCLKPGAIVLDSCGVKQAIVKPALEILKGRPVRFLGAHPMAGREFSGFAHSTPTLYEGASFLLTPPDGTDQETVDLVAGLMRSLGFSRIVVTTPEEHDQIIAFTSQLAHVVSSAYIKSPTLQKNRGFSAGSFQDLTRVAKLDENLWTELFSRNREALLFEVEHIIKELDKYRKVLEEKDDRELKRLLLEGRILKEESLQLAKEGIDL